MFSSELSTMTNAELVGVYNGLNPDKPLSGWKGKKDVLIDRIAALRGPAAEDVSKAPEPKAPVEATEEASGGGAVTEATGNSSERTIRAAAIEHLCHIDYYEDRGKKPGSDNVVDKGTKGARSVGLAYDEIINRIKQEFPDCETSVACLRWYSVKIRVEEHGYEGLTLPQRRPRAKPRKA